MDAAQTNLNLSTKRENYLKQYIREQVIPQRFINYGRNMKLSKCIGIIGPRGSCKSIAASAMGIIDYLIPGYKLVSNMSVQWALRLGTLIAAYRSDDLDKMELMKFNIEDNVAVLVDEVNIEFSEARRSMTNRNLIFNKILQQLRKRALNMIYTVQHEMWIDNRLRWQTDIFIKTQDVCLRPGGIYLPYDFGEYASWKLFDMSGIFGQGTYSDTYTPVIDGWQFSAKQWWNTFDTKQIQGIETEVYGGNGAEPIDIKRSEYVIKEQNNLARLYEVIQEFHDKGYELIEAEELWKALDITSKAGKNYVGSILRERMGIKYANRKYRIPQADLDRPETMKAPILVNN